MGSGECFCALGKVSVAVSKLAGGCKKGSYAQFDSLKVSIERDHCLDRLTQGLREQIDNLIEGKHFEQVEHVQGV